MINLPKLSNYKESVLIEDSACLAVKLVQQSSKSVSARSTDCHSNDSSIDSSLSSQSPNSRASRSSRQLKTTNLDDELLGSNQEENHSRKDVTHLRVVTERASEHDDALSRFVSFGPETPVFAPC